MGTVNRAAPWTELRKRCKILVSMSIEERSRRRRERIEVHRAGSFEDAELWDLDYWQRRTPQERLSALVAIRNDVALAQAARARLEESAE